MMQKGASTNCGLTMRRAHSPHSRKEKTGAGYHSAPVRQRRAKNISAQSLLVAYFARERTKNVKPAKSSATKASNLPSSAGTSLIT